MFFEALVIFTKLHTTCSIALVFCRPVALITLCALHFDGLADFGFLCHDFSPIEKTYRSTPESIDSIGNES